MSEEGQTESEKRIARMDRVADKLLELVEAEGTSDMQKGRLFAQVLDWYKAREKLVPSGEGDKLKEMSDAIKSKSGGRSGNSGRSASRARDGKAIERIIKSLPSYDRNSGGDQARAQRQSGSAGGDGRGARINGGGDGDGDVDGVGDGRVV